MEDNSFDPRTWVDSQDGAARSESRTGQDGFALASGTALRLWLVSALILGITATAAWAMRSAKDASVGHPADARTEQAPAP